MVAIATKSHVFVKNESILIARQRTSHVMYLLSISLLQNIANTLSDTISEIKGPLFYCFSFERILNSWLPSQKCRQRKRTSLRDGLRLPSNQRERTSLRDGLRLPSNQRERTSLRDGLRLPSNGTLKIIRRQLLDAMKP